jgi:hypothetical protein
MSDKHEERLRAWRQLQRGGPVPDRDIQFATDQAVSLEGEAARLVVASVGVSWYTEPGNEADAAVVALCRLRRASSGEARASEGGDRAVRRVLEKVDTEALVWVASRAISYMDEQGFPELVEPWLARR